MLKVGVDHELLAESLSAVDRERLAA